jgi:hypothetical protein
MVEHGVQIWSGPIEQCPWWWAFILQVEKRIESLKESAGLDPEKLPPPRDLWPLNRSDDLEVWFDDREELRKKLAREPKVLDT